MKRQELGPEESAGLADALGTVSSDARFRLFDVIGCRGPLAVVDVAAALEVEQSVVSHQLRPMRLRGLVVRFRRGRSQFYSLSPAGRRLFELVRSFAAQHGEV